MKKLNGSVWAKLLAIILLVTCVVTVLAGALAIVLLAEHGAYDRSVGNVFRDFLYSEAKKYTYAVSRIYAYGEPLEESYYAHMDNFRFKVEEDGVTVFNNNDCDPADVTYFVDESFYYGQREQTGSVRPENVTPSDAPQPVDTRNKRIPYTVTGYVLLGPSNTDEIGREYGLFLRGYQYRYRIVAVVIAAFLVGIALFVFLMGAAGHRKGTDGIVPTFVEKIPFDLFLAFCVAAVGLLIGAAGSIADDSLPVIAAILAMFLLAGLIALLFFMSLAIRLKTGGLLKSCLCWKLLAWLGRGLRKFFVFVGNTLRAVPLIPKTLLITGGVLLLDFLWIFSLRDDGEVLLLGWLVSRAALVLLLLYAAKSAKTLSDGAKKLASGELDAEVDTAKLRGVFRTHGEDLNSIRSGLNAAVNERLKSERFRAELITNVSHDIKTPLTSIVNYVDLLSKEELSNETAKGYVEVLSRQSAKLKKLTEDLVEASKASTGSLHVDPVQCELGVLLTQSAGEYGEKLAARSLELIVTKPETPVTILADGRHLWRIFDNLLGNVCKYALPGTRVYLDLAKKDGAAQVILRNISETRLNISADELFERFVRGDSARSTEGSGLGLSIARSLAELQGGTLSVTVDGDLFKAELTFPCAE